MVWTVKSDDDNAIIQEMAKQTDRGAVLIATAYLEERLVDAIKARLIRDEDIESTFFKGVGPLASLSSRIHLAYLLGIYEKKVHRFFLTVKDIRNAFAHKSEPLNFTTQKISALCLNINVGLEATLEMPHPETGEIIQVPISIKPDGTPKTAFFNCVMFLLICLDMELKKEPPRKPAPPVVPPI